MPNIMDMARKKRHIALLEKLQHGKTLSRSELKELVGFEKGDSRLEVVETQEQLAKVFRVSLRTVQRWAKEEGMPVTRNGHYDLLEVQAWRLSKKNKESRPDSDRQKWDARYRQIKARRAELEFKKSMGELISKKEVDAGHVERIMVIKRAFLTLPQAVAPVLAGLDSREIQVVLTMRIQEIIRKFSGQDDEPEKKEGSKK